MKVARIDVAIIGAGTAGVAAYRAAGGAGATAMLIEGGAYGTTCARSGCMPSKLLIAAADAAHAIETAPRFGVHADGVVRIDGRAVMDRVRRERDRFVGFALRDVERIAEADRLRGHAEFVDDHTLEVGRHTRVVARAVVIATGSRPTRVDSFGALGDRLIVSDNVFDWQDLPKSVAVIGSGIIGPELGQALHRLGVRVAILGRGGRVGPISDPEVLAYSIAAFKREFTLEPDAHIAMMRRDGNRIAIDRTAPDGAKQFETFDFHSGCHRPSAQRPGHRPGEDVGEARFQGRASVRPGDRADCDRTLKRSRGQFDLHRRRRGQLHRAAARGGR